MLLGQDAIWATCILDMRLASTIATRKEVWPGLKCKLIAGGLHAKVCNLHASGVWLIGVAVLMHMVCIEFCKYILFSFLCSKPFYCAVHMQQTFLLCEAVY